MTKEKKYMIIGIFILMITLVGGVGTYAWFTWKSTSNTSLTMTIGKMADVTFSSGNDISTNKLAPVYNYTDGEKTTFIINNRDTTNTFLKYKILAEVTYNTAGYNDATLYPNEIYTYERGSTVYSGRQTTWTGKIGLMYPSDYGYASDLTKCREKINNYNASTCSQNNWIYNMGSLWLLTHDSARSDRNWSINSSGNASVNGNGNGGTSNGLLVFPSLFLSSDVKIISGNGSINNPYQLGV